MHIGIHNLVDTVCEYVSIDAYYVDRYVGKVCTAVNKNEQ